MEEKNDDKKENIEVEENKENQNDKADKIGEIFDKIANPKDLTSEFTLDEVELNKKNVLVCYIGFLFILPMIKPELRKSPYALFHINQGVNLFIFEIIVFIISEILHLMFTKVYFYSSYTPLWVSFICYILYCITIVLSLFGIINTYNGKSKELPLLFNLNLIK